MNGAIGATLREDERVAARALDRGCAEDLTAVERFLVGPLHNAECEMRDEIAALGDGDPILRRNLVAQSMEAIADRCWERVFANVALRFRARFSLYAEALQSAEERFFVEADVPGSVRRRRRRVLLPRVVAPDVPALTFEEGGVESMVLGCVAQLERNLREAIANEVTRARGRLIRRGALDLARTRIACQLAGGRSRGSLKISR